MTAGLTARIDSEALRSSLSTVESPHPVLFVAPRMPEDRDFAELSDELLDAEIGAVLADVLADVQRALPGLTGHSGRIVFLLPHDVALGRPHATAAGAVAGALLSMARTLAIELGRDGITVNTILYAEGTEPAVAGQVAALVAPAGDAVTGQEIYVTAGSGLGRLRP
ncbi:MULTISPECIES: SDR family oxidoreductase [Amycolatopsis]|uniref:Enoyl-(Acyl carrier protein) reductase n=2 Tax=Amycolatopsis TaxID=1813 RepID=A0A1I3WP87_9PSEU|nr:SDR family oxidoreductase [Amycolatopsis sacchari]SFK08286.1 Enoyl-(Acyl carrier protein) reductase [Amycolatopsis sacchari]